MKLNVDSLASQLASIIGNEHLSENEVRIGSLRPFLMAEPGNAAEVAACLKICSDAGAAIVPAGAMTWLDCGNPLRRAEVILSLRRMTEMIEYSPPDLTVTAEAGLSLQALNEHLSQQRLWLPLDPPGERASTLGAIAACASSGSLRLGYGTPRDHVIGLRLAHIDGTESKSGGRVVKNVAGYDLNKLYVGSYGTLAVITQLTFKLRPLPETSATVMVAANTYMDVVDAAKQIQDSADLQPASMLLADRAVSGVSRYVLFIRFVDSESAVRQQVEMAKRLVGNASLMIDVVTEEESLWLDLCNLNARFAADERLSLVRLNVPMSRTAEVLKKAGEFSASAVAHLGVGVINVALTEETAPTVEMINALRNEARLLGGNLVIERAPAAVREQCNAWEEAGDLTTLMRGIKQNFDPQSLLNPGRFVAGI